MSAVQNQSTTLGNMLFQPSSGSTATAVKKRDDEDFHDFSFSRVLRDQQRPDSFATRERTEVNQSQPKQQGATPSTESPQGNGVQTRETDFRSKPEQEPSGKAPVANSEVREERPDVSETPANANVSKEEREEQVPVQGQQQNEELEEESELGKEEQSLVSALNAFPFFEMLLKSFSLRPLGSSPVSENGTMELALPTGRLLSRELKQILTLMEKNPFAATRRGDTPLLSLSDLQQPSFQLEDFLDMLGGEAPALQSPSGEKWSSFFQTLTVLQARIVRSEQVQVPELKALGSKLLQQVLSADTETPATENLPEALSEVVSKIRNAGKQAESMLPSGWVDALKEALTVLVSGLEETGESPTPGAFETQGLPSLLADLEKTLEELLSQLETGEEVDPKKLVAFEVMIVVVYRTIDLLAGRDDGWMGSVNPSLELSLFLLERLLQKWMELVGTDEGSGETGDTATLQASAHLPSKDLLSLLAKSSTTVNQSVLQTNWMELLQQGDGSKVLKDEQSLWLQKDEKKVLLETFTVRYTVQRKPSEEQSKPSLQSLSQRVGLPENSEEAQTRTMQPKRAISATVFQKSLMAVSRSVAFNGLEASSSKESGSENVSQRTVEAPKETQKPDIVAASSRGEQKTSHSGGESSEQRDSQEAPAAKPTNTVTNPMVFRGVEAGTVRNLEQVVAKIQQLMQLSASMSRPVETATLSLSPARLGTVQLEIVKEGAHLSVVMRVETLEAKEMLERNSHLLVNRLAQNGFEIQKVQVHMERYEEQGGNQQDNPQQDGSGQDGGQNQNDDNPQDQTFDRTFAELLTGGDGDVV